VNGTFLEQPAGAKGVGGFSETTTATQRRKKKNGEDLRLGGKRDATTGGFANGSRAPEEDATMPLEASGGADGPKQAATQKRNATDYERSMQERI